MFSSRLRQVHPHRHNPRRPQVHFIDLSTNFLFLFVFLLFFYWYGLIKYMAKTKATIHNNFFIVALLLYLIQYQQFAYVIMHRVRYRARQPSSIKRKNGRWGDKYYQSLERPKDASRNSSQAPNPRSSVARISTFSKTAVTTASKNISG